MRPLRYSAATTALENYEPTVWGVYHPERIASRNETHTTDFTDDRHPSIRGSPRPTPGDRLANRVALLEIEDLRVEFGAAAPVDGVSLALDAGRTLGLVGESGCGKTLTALAVMRLVPPPGHVGAGRVRFDGGISSRSTRARCAPSAGAPSAWCSKSR